MIKDLRHSREVFMEETNRPERFTLEECAEILVEITMIRHALKELEKRAREDLEYQLSKPPPPRLSVVK